MRTGGLALAHRAVRIMKQLGLMFCFLSCAERKCENARHNESGFYVLNENNFKCQKANESSGWNACAASEGEKEIIYKRILMDDPQKGNLFICWSSREYDARVLI